MGAETSVLRELEFDDEDGHAHSETAGGLNPRKARRKDGTLVSVFMFEKGSKELDNKDNSAKQLKVLRHPGIVRFLDWSSYSEGRVLITEYVEPLSAVFENLTAPEICAGLYNIIEALAFLHDRGGLCHNNVCMSSIFVDEDGSWKLGGMEFLCRFEQATPTYLKKCQAERNQTALAPEEKTEGILSGHEWGHTRDVYAFGILAESMLEMLQDLGEMTKTFELCIQDECLCLDPKARPKLSTLLEDRLFQTEYVEILNFLRNITLKEEEEKSEFFKNVVQKLHLIPEEVVAKRLLRPLVSRFVLLESSALDHLLPHLLVPCADSRRSAYVEGEINPILTEKFFKSHLIPQLFKIFHVRDAHIRLVLLKNFASYIRLFELSTLRNVIFPQVLVGVRDTNDELVAASLYALAELVPMLGGNTVVGSQRAKYFSEGTPRFPVSSKPSAFQRQPVVTNGPKVTPSPVNINKPTLMDLARDNEKAQKREEARQRREERRQLREDALQSKKENPPDRLEVQEKHDDVVQITVSPASDSSPSSGLTADTTELHIPPRVMRSDSDDTRLPSNKPSPSDEGKGNWSDWENEDDKSDGIVDYDAEIENELRSIESTAKIDMYSHSDTYLHSSRNNMSSPAKSKSPMKLQMKSKQKTSPPPESASRTAENGIMSAGHSAENGLSESMSQVDSSFNDWGSDWDTEKQTSSWGEDNLTSHETSTTSVHSSPAHKKSQEPLGAEFDIKSIDIKKIEKPADDPFNFFADMEPTINKQPSLLETLASTGLVDGDKDKKSSLNFAVQLTDEGGDGWGDDDWGVDEDLN